VIELPLCPDAPPFDRSAGVKTFSATVFDQVGNQSSATLTIEVGRAGSSMFNRTKDVICNTYFEYSQHKRINIHRHTVQEPFCSLNLSPLPPPQVKSHAAE
jgi:hypothetical protein